MRVLHLAEAAQWEDAQTTGWYRWSTRGLTLDQVGYLHASTTTQIAGVAARFYGDVDPADHLLLVIDIDTAEQAGTSVRWELPPDAGSAFPHFYGPLPVSAVVAALPLPAWDPTGGGFAPPDLTGLDVAVSAPQ